MKHWIGEGLHTLSVATVHPIGWGLKRLKEKNKEELTQVCDMTAPVFFVHGVLHNASAFYQFEKSLKKRGYEQIRSIELLTSIKSIEELSERLKLEIAVYLEKNKSRPHQKIQILAHSLGGIVTRAALMDSLFAEQVEKAVFLGTPHQGLKLRAPLNKIPLPRSLYDVDFQSKLMQQMKKDPLPGGIQYWNLRGQLDFVTPMSSTFLPHVPNVDFVGVGHAGLLSNSKVIQTVVEILQAPLYSERAHAQNS